MGSRIIHLVVLRWKKKEEQANPPPYPPKKKKKINKRQKIL